MNSWLWLAVEIVTPFLVSASLASQPPQPGATASQPTALRADAGDRAAALANVNEARFSALLASAGWAEYARCLADFGRAFPAAVVPLERLRGSRLNVAELEGLVGRALGPCRAAAKADSVEGRRDALRTASRVANAELREWALGLEKRGVGIWGGEATWIRGLPADARQELSPLDELFGQTAAGQKLRLDLRIGATGTMPDYELDLKKRQLRFPASDYRFEAVEKNGELRLRGRRLSSGEPVGSDATFRSADFVGGFFRDDKLAAPFGPYPAARQLWRDEGGHSHFKGDGHKH